MYFVELKPIDSVGRQIDITVSPGYLIGDKPTGDGAQGEAKVLMANREEHMGMRR